MKRLAISCFAAAVVASGVFAQDAGDRAEPSPEDRSEDRVPAREADDDVFVPTEEVQAEDEIVFPVDI